MAKLSTFLLKSPLTVVFFFIGIFHLIGSVLSVTILVQATKPLLILSLGSAFIAQVGGVSALKRILHWMILGALTFSLVGDILLMFVDQRPTYFIFGLASFLLAHIFYILIFIKILRDSGWSRVQVNYKSIIVCFAYLILLFVILLPNIPKSYTLPIISYGLVITIMLVTSLTIYFTKPDLQSLILVFGTTLFVLSDSIIAVNKFYYNLPLAGVLIMSTYLAAQYFIVSFMVAYSVSDLDV